MVALVVVDGVEADRLAGDEDNAVVVVVDVPVGVVAEGAVREPDVATMVSTGGTVVVAEEHTTCVDVDDTVVVVADCMLAAEGVAVLAVCVTHEGALAAQPVPSPMTVSRRQGRCEARPMG